MNDTPTISELFDSLGYGKPGTDIDEAVRWALAELHLRRDAMALPKVSDRVRVVNFADKEGAEAHGHLLGKSAFVSEIISNGLGIGESVEDPVYGLVFDDGEDALFFGEEIQKV